MNYLIKVFNKRDNEVLITHLKLPYSKFMWATLVFRFSWALYFSASNVLEDEVDKYHVPCDEAYIYFCHLDKAVVI